MDRKIVICEHAPLRAQGFRRFLPAAKIVKTYQGEVIPESFDLLILGGGPMSAGATDRRQHPFLEKEFKLIQEIAFSRKQAPKLCGVCLGAQLITLALGGEVVKGEFVRGWNLITPVNPGPYFLAGTVPQFEYHQDHLTRLPDGAQLLAFSEKDAIEAFSFGEGIIATVYHPEITADFAPVVYSSAGLSAIELQEERFADPGPLAETASQNFFQALLKEK